MTYKELTMDISKELLELNEAKDNILSAISDMGVNVPEGSGLVDCPDLIQSGLSNYEAELAAL